MDEVFVGRLRMVKSIIDTIYVKELALFVGGQVEADTIDVSLVKLEFNRSLLLLIACLHQYITI